MEKIYFAYKIIFIDQMSLQIYSLSEAGQNKRAEEVEKIIF